MVAGIPNTPRAVAQSATNGASANYDQAEIIRYANASTVQFKCFGTRGGRSVASSGAGVVISADGYILTALHVVDGFERIRVTTAYGDILDGAVVVTERDWDIALVKVTPTTPLVVAPFASTARVSNGREALVVGNPLGMGQHLSKGILGSVRTVNWDGHRAPLRSVSAPVKKGHSGGGTYDLHTGELLGINVAKSSAQENTGFFVPVDRLAAILNRRLAIVELADAEEIYNQLGVRLRGVKLIGNKFKHGVLLTEVVPGSVADLAGWEVGDVLVGLGDYKTADQSAVLYVLRNNSQDLSELRYVMARGDAVDTGSVAMAGTSPALAVSDTAPQPSLAGMAR